MQTNSIKPDRQVIDIYKDTRILNISASPIWVYDSVSCCNVWGNRAALELFQADAETFKCVQTSSSWSPEQLRLWTMLNAQLHQDVEVGHNEANMIVTGCEPVPSFLPVSTPGLAFKAVFTPVAIKSGGDSVEQDVTLVQVIQQTWRDVENDHMRMVEMCNNHPMFQFLFDENGMLLTANKQAMYNMREHLGSHENYNLQMYLTIGECESSEPGEMYDIAMRAIFVEDKPCHRFPQLRWSKRYPGKFRWVLYEMWPLVDPVTDKRAVLVCEQNISQVKALEDQFKRQNKRLEAQLEEVLAMRDLIHKPAIDIDTPADKTLKLLDKLMNGDSVDTKEALDLRDAILRAGDLRQPVNFNEQVMQAHSGDADVSQSLIQLLSTRPTKSDMEDEPQQVPTSGKPRPHPHIPTPTTPMSTAGAHSFLQLTKNMPDELNRALSRIEDWEYNAFSLSEASQGRPLSVLSFYLLKRCELFTKYQMEEHKLVKLLICIENRYPNNPYHNRIHAADVLRTLHVLVTQGGLKQQGFCDDVSLFACYLSAIIHDYEHRGVNNDYLVRVSEPLAILYNDRSPMENHHLAAAFTLLNNPAYNFMAGVPQRQREYMRKLVIDLVLATDMKQHFAIHSMFQSKLQVVSSCGGNESDSGSDHQLMPMNDVDKSLVLQMALKCADLGHLTCSRAVHMQWVHYLEEEFFLQGDREKQQQLLVSPLMDRSKNGISMSQVGFFDIVALPLFQSFTHAFPKTQPMLDAVKDNYAMWREMHGALDGRTTNPGNH